MASPPVPSPPPNNEDHKIKVTVADVVPTFLDPKLVMGYDLVKTVQNPGGNELLRLDVAVRAIWSGTRFFAVDPAGDDANAGFSDVSQAAAFAVAKKTVAGLIAIVPRVGAGRDAQVAFKPGVYAEELALRGYTGYRSFYVVASTDGSDDATDHIRSGFVTAQAGPGGGGVWTTAGGATTSVLSVSAGTLGAESATVLRRVRFTGNVTGALANVCAAVWANSSTQITLCDDLPTAPAAGDTFLIEQPGAVFTEVVFQDVSCDQMAARGVRSSGTWTSSSIYATSEIYTGCEADGSVLIDGHARVQTIGTFTPLGGGSVRVGVGMRSGSELKFRNVAELVTPDRSGGIVGCTFWGVRAGAFGDGCVSLSQIDCRGVGMGRLGYAGSSFFGGFTFGSINAGFRPLRTEMAGLGSLIIIASRVGLQNATLCFSGPATCVTLVEANSQLDVGSGVTFNGTAISTRLAINTLIKFDSAAAPTFLSTPNVTVTRSVSTSYADVATMTSIRDGGNNLLWVSNFSAPLIDPPAAEPTIRFFNDSGGTMAPGQALWISGHTNGVEPKCQLATAAGLASSKVAGICCTTTLDQQYGLMVAANAGVPYALIDGTVAAGAPVYVSATPGHLTSTSPSLPNITVQAGVSLDGNGTSSPGNSHVLLQTKFPSGSAMGDLAGQYPNPDVAAIHETSGPTQLVIGAVADGQVLKRSGATLVGQTAFFQTVKDSAATTFQTAVLKFSNGSIATVGGETVVTLANPGVEIDTVGSGLTLSAGTLTNNLLTGLAGGQTVTGGTASAENLDLRSTSHATKGLTRVGGATGLVYDETNKRLGLNVATPTASLQLGTTDLVTAVLGAQVGAISLQNSAGYCGVVAGKDASTVAYFLQHSSGDAVLATTGRMLVQAGGSNMLIIDATLGLSGSQSAGGALILNSTTHATKGKIFFGIAENAAYDDANDRLGLGTGSPAVQLHTTGAVRFANFGAGAATFDASGNVSSVSDERLKDVVARFPHGLAAVNRLGPVLYRWRPESGLETEHVYPGFLAQDVERAMPESVGRTPDGFLSLQDRGLTAALVNAVQELAARVVELEARP